MCAMTTPLIPATVIGSWSFPGWYEKFIQDVARDPAAFGPVDREEALQDAIRLAVDDQLQGRSRPNHRRRDATRRLQPRLLRVS